MKNLNFKAGDTILVEGAEGDSAFFIEEGSVEVIVGQGADAKVVSTLEAGEVFGEMSLIEAGPRSASVKALSDTICTVTNYQDFIKILKDHPEQGIQFMKTLVLRLRQMNVLISKMDPKKRSFRDILKEWLTAPDPLVNVSQKEGDPLIYYPIMNPWMF